MRKENAKNQRKTSGTLSLPDFIDFLEQRGSNGIRYVFIDGDDEKMNIQLLPDIFYRRHGK